jgi:hypothetical protein
MGKITYNRGTTFNLGHVYQINGVNATTGTKLFFTVKAVIDDDITDALAVFKKNINMSGPNTTITILPSDIPDTVDNGNYVYDIKIQDSVLGIQLADSGKFKLTVTATNRIS